MSEHTRPLPIVVIRLPNWVGDVCMVLPSLQLLSQSGVPLLICGKAFAKPLLNGLSYLEFVTFSGRAWSDQQQLRKSIKSLRHSQVIGTRQPVRGLLYPDSFTSALTYKLAGVPAMGYRDDGRHFLLKWPVHKSRPHPHAVLKWYQLTCHAISTWSLPLTEPLKAEPAIYHFTPSEDDIQQAELLLQDHQLKSNTFVLLAPTATGLHKGQIKVWPDFSALAKQLQQQGITVVTCPPAHEREQAQAAVPNALMLDPLPLGAFTYLCRLAHLVVCNDSGVSHLAAIAGARQLTLFGVTDPKQTGPWSTQAEHMGTLGQWPDLSDVFTQCMHLLKHNAPDVRCTQIQKNH